MSTLSDASRQWASRPADERYTSVQALHEACSAERDRCVQSKVIPTNTLRVIPAGDNLLLNGATGTKAEFTNWSFGTLARRVQAPAEYLASLPASVAADALNHGLSHSGETDSRLLLRQTGDGYLCRAVTSGDYSRVWNVDVTTRLLTLEERGPWQPAPAAFDGSRGLYAGDRDMFAFMVDNGRRIFERANGGLSRGFFVWNTEQGPGISFGIKTFLYEYVCGNHIVWGASGIREIRLRHVGDVNDRAWGAMTAELRKYADSSAQEDEARIEAAQKCLLGGTKDEVLDRIFGLRLPAISQGRAREAYDLAEERVDWYGDPRSAWGFANGLTELSQAKTVNADARVALDRAAGKVLEVAF